MTRKMPIFVWLILGVFSFFIGCLVSGNILFLIGDLAESKWGSSVAYYFPERMAWWRDFTTRWWIGIVISLAILFFKPRSLVFAASIGAMTISLVYVYYMLFNDLTFINAWDFLSVVAWVYTNAAITAALLAWQGQRIQWQLIGLPVSRPGKEKPDSLASDDKIYHL